MLIFDIETNGLLEDVTKVHCMAILDTATDEIFRYRPNEIQEGVQRLLQGDTICGHNVIAFDIPVLEKLYNVKFNEDYVLDTLVLARLVYSNIGDIDAGLIRKGTLPKNLYGSHSLKAYGYRLGVLKGTYAEDTEEAWAVFNEDMLEYNVQDCIVTKALYDKCKSKGYTEKSSKLEHKVQWLMQQQERNGFPFDTQKAIELVETLTKRSVELESELEALSPKIPDVVFIPKKDNKKLGYVAGVPIQKYKPFNPNSRLQLRYILEKHYHYPFSDDRMYDIELDEEGNERSRKLKLNEETLDLIANDKSTTKEIRYIAKSFSEYLMLSKRLGQIANGQNAWLKLVADDGRIHGRCNPNGAVSGRATHSSPNLSQVPSVNSPYGKECRELFCVPEGWYQAGIDCSGLELRCLAHYLYPFDDGAYAHEILNGDIHTMNMHSAGLSERSQAKTFNHK